jgi:peptidoglycan DL-endopeptidase CwlO
VALVLAGSSGADQAAAPSAAGNLGTREHAVVLSLYSLDTKLAAARQRIASLEHRADTVRAAQQETAQAAHIARRAWTDSVEALGAHLRAIYEQDEADALAIFFGSSSIDDAVTRIDALQRSAQLNRQTVAQTRAARAQLRTLKRELDIRAAQLATLLAQARDTAAALERTHTQRVAYLASLRRQRAWTARRIAKASAVAQAGATKSTSAPAAPTADSAPAPTLVASGQTMTVSSTGYSLPGTTATGLPVGWGVVAVDPSVIPLGTRMTIPGYGEGVAADTGSAVVGSTIDLWFPTQAQAMAWGRRTVTITLH